MIPFHSSVFVWRRLVADWSNLEVIIEVPRGYDLWYIPIANRVSCLLLLLHRLFVLFRELLLGNLLEIVLDGEGIGSLLIKGFKLELVQIVLKGSEIVLVRHGLIEVDVVNKPLE